MNILNTCIFNPKPNKSPGILQFLLSSVMPYSHLFLMLAMALFGATIAANHEIGDVAGWTAAGTVDYTSWASTNNFQVGDRLDFKYNRQFHNVMEVSHQDFESCNSSSPILTYTTGYDSVELMAAGHHYYMCSIPGHCHAGQKLDIFVHCDADGPDPTPPDHLTNSSSFLNNINSFSQLVLCYFVWLMFV